MSANVALVLLDVKIGNQLLNCTPYQQVIIHKFAFTACVAKQINYYCFKIRKKAFLAMYGLTVKT